MIVNKKQKRKGARTRNVSTGFEQGSQAILEEKLQELAQDLPEGYTLNLKGTPDLSHFIKKAEEQEVRTNSGQVSVTCTGDEDGKDNVNKFRLYSSQSFEIEAPFKLELDAGRVYFIFPMFSFDGHYIFSNQVDCVPDTDSGGCECKKVGREMSWKLEPKLKFYMNDKTYELPIEVIEGAYKPGSDRTPDIWDGAIEYSYIEFLNSIDSMPELLETFQNFLYITKEPKPVTYTVSLVINVTIEGSGGVTIDLCDKGNGFYSRDIIVLSDETIKQQLETRELATVQT